MGKCSCILPGSSAGGALGHYYTAGENPLLLHGIGQCNLCLDPQWPYFCLGQKEIKIKIIKKYICLYHVVLSHLPAIVSVLDFEGCISVHHLKLAFTVSHI